MRVIFLYDLQAITRFEAKNISDVIYVTARNVCVTVSDLSAFGKKLKHCLHRFSGCDTDPFPLMPDRKDLKAGLFYSLFHCFFFIVNNAGSDIDPARL